MEDLRIFDVSHDIAFDLLNWLAVSGDEAARSLQMEIYNRDTHKTPTECEHILVGLFELDAVAAIKLAFRHPQGGVRAMAATLVGERKDDQLLPEIAAGLLDKAAEVREATFSAYAACQSQDGKILGPFLDFLKGGGPGLHVMLNMLHYPHAVEEILQALLGVFDRHPADGAIFDWMEVALRFYQDKERLAAEVRERLMAPTQERYALYLLRDVGTAEDLRPYLDHGDLRYVQAAAQGLMRLNLPEDRPRLVALFERLKAAGALS